MTAIQTPFGSDAGKWAFQGSPKLVNCHVEIRQEGGKSRYVVNQCDGSTLFSSVTDTPSRGAFYLDDLDYALSCHSGRLWKVTSGGTATSKGVIPGIDKVRFARNNKTNPQVVVRCNAGAYLFDTADETVSKIIDDDLPAVEDICDIDGYVVYAASDGRYFISGLNEVTTIDALDFASAEQSPDKLVAPRSFGGFLFLFGKKTIEPHKNTGNADFPFEPMPSVIPRGCIGKWTIAECDNALIFIGDDGIVYRLNGFQPEAISTHEIERLIRAESDPSAIEAQSWSKDGHAFCEIKGENFSKVYDARTRQWHDRASYGQSTWRHSNAFAAWNKIVVGDRLTGNLYYHDETANTEAGGTQIATMRFPTLNVFPNGGILHALHLDFLTGQGVTSPTAQGYNPLLMLRVSKDGGNSFAFERNLATGKRGSYGRVKTRRLGKLGPQGAVIELAMSDPVGRSLALADVAVSPLKR